MPNDGVLPRQAAMELALDSFGGKSVRLRILLACKQQPMSAAEIAGDRTEIAGVSYHVRELAKGGLLRFVREEQRRGAVAKFYVSTPKGDRLLSKLGLPESEDASA